MAKTVLKVENLSKLYRLGEVGTGTISHDLNRWWAKMRRKDDPYAQVGAVNDRTQKAEKGEQIWALKDINFEVKQGEVLGIIGKNGAGKSTLLKLLSRITAPTTGNVKIKGRVASLLEVGTGMHPEMTGRENVYLNGTILGMSKKEISSKFAEIMDFAGCAKYADTPVKRYSSGMKVRLGFAVAAFLEPEILIVDEVLAVGDAEFQKKAIGKMQDISHGQGRTVLFVSHNMASVKSICEKVIILTKGGITYSGDTDKGISEYLKLNETGTLEEGNISRVGSGVLKIKKVNLLDNYGKSVDSILSGQSVEFHLQYTAQESIDPEKIIVAIQIRDSNGNVISSFISDEMGLNITDYSTEGRFILKIPQLNIRGGNYHLKARINYGTTSYKDILDEIENVYSFHVIPGDFWNMGKTQRSFPSALFASELILTK